MRGLSEDLHGHLPYFQCEQTEFKRRKSPLKCQMRCVAMFPDKQGFLVISKTKANLAQPFHVFVRSQKTEYIFPHLSK